jgi:hypothetical protein
MSQYVICINNEGYEDDLDLFKVYQVAPAEAGDDLAQDVIRIIDNTGEDYLYSAKRFEPVTLTPVTQVALAQRTVAPG